MNSYLKFIASVYILISAFNHEAFAQAGTLVPTATPGTELNSGALIQIHPSSSLTFGNPTATPSSTPFRQSPHRGTNNMNLPTRGRSPASLPGDYQDNDSDTGIETEVPPNTSPTIN